MTLIYIMIFTSKFQPESLTHVVCSQALEKCQLAEVVKEKDGKLDSAGGHHHHN